MYVAFFIARRYFLASRKKTLTYFISLLSLVSIALSTMALLISLSIFNGLEDLIKSLFRSFDPDLKIECVQGKSFLKHDIDPVIQAIQQLHGVAKVIEVIEDNVIARYQGRQMIVKLKGVSTNFLQANKLTDFIVEGKFVLHSTDQNFALIGRGIQYNLGIRLENELSYLQMLYPTIPKQRNIMLSSQLFQSKYIRPGAIFAIEKNFDDHYIIAPLDFAAQLMKKEYSRTALEVQLKQGSHIKTVQSAISAILPNNFCVLTNDEQHKGLTKALRIEKLILIVTFLFILLITSLNIFFSLSILGINKKKDIAILYALGATKYHVRAIFILNGFLIAFFGVVLGVVAALCIIWSQQTFEWLSLGIETSVVQAYPIQAIATDFIMTIVLVILLTLLAVLRPAKIAAKVVMNKHL